MLFWGLMIFIRFHIFFMSKGIENIPFFLYNMYGQQHLYKDSNAVFLIATPRGYFNHKNLSNRQQELLLNSVSHYIKLSRDGDGTGQTIKNRFGDKAGYNYLVHHLTNDSAALATFPTWWGRYFSSITKYKYDSVSVVKSYMYSSPPHIKSNFDSLLFSLKLK